ncbi:MAG: hypothetical protein AAB531_04655, partial [Patescibacteria group bacterium]
SGSEMMLRHGVAIVSRTRAFRREGGLFGIISEACELCSKKSRNELVRFLQKIQRARRQPSSKIVGAKRLPIKGSSNFFV